MSKMLSRALFVAAAIGAAGIAQAQTVVVESQPTVVTGTYYRYSGELQPANGFMEREYTYNVPQQAGEASTMTNGVPNAATNNHPTPSSVVVGTVVMPATVVTTTEIR